jgi:hypothetical protein
MGAPWKANIVHVKANRDAYLKLIEKAVKVKAQKGWSKSCKFKRVEDSVGGVDEKSVEYTQVAGSKRVFLSH